MLSEQGALLDGVFQQLLDPEAFRRLVYKDTPAAELRPGAPMSLQQLLDHPTFASELEDLVPAAEAKAASVLANVKKRGAREGDAMDARTEALLRPQILREAFGRELVKCIERVNRAVFSAMARFEAFFCAARDTLLLLFCSRF